MRLGALPSCRFASSTCRRRSTAEISFASAGRHKCHRTIRQHHDLLRVVGHADGAQRGQRLRVEQLQCGIVAAGHQHRAPVGRDARQPRLRAGSRSRHNLLAWPCRSPPARSRPTPRRRRAARREKIPRQKAPRPPRMRFADFPGGGIQHPNVSAPARRAPNLFSRRQRPQARRPWSDRNRRDGRKAGQIHHRYRSIARVGHVGIQVQPGAEKRGPVLALDLHDGHRRQHHREKYQPVIEPPRHFVCVLRKSRYRDFRSRARV